jgi:hypothetical protein
LNCRPWPFPLEAIPRHQRREAIGAAIVGGNDLDDFLTRDEARSSLLAASDDEIARGQARLKTLDEQLWHFRFLKAALQSRFPDFKAGVEKARG